ncbi:hypothetical protein GKC30_13495 [Pseudodesulfovibrio sp. F-1]|uniref:ATP-binding protein n=1 Tax=Pseudodesulfovibrio alkaliphilus TaxID=2661613 RepID=A0A7K1KRD3_9BACT|nr:hypothetical protein [Pseudodesulfovibrio alkaliphilus]MUM78649.1 hypothetical protein [Pseudodesulfovibrio alkaliphilus]
MQAVVRWMVMPRRRDVGIVNAGLGVWMGVEGYGPLDSRRLQVCVEGVFSYCAGSILSCGCGGEIVVSLFRADDDLRVLMQHGGPAGEWDECLKLDGKPPIRRTSFDAMGLFIAREMLHSLTCDSRYDVATGSPLRTYEMVYRPMAFPVRS